jgi:hypothetical protein
MVYCVTVPSHVVLVRRNGKAVWSGQTRQQLKDTTLRSWIEWIKPGVFGKWKESEMIFQLRFKDVESDIMFRALDSPEDVQRVLSMEASAAWINEAREIPLEILQAIMSRVGRFPRRDDVPEYRSFVLADTNPPEFESMWYKILEHQPIEENNPDSVMEVDSFHQPSGTSAEAENVENLRPDYYQELAKGKTKAWVDTYVHGLYAPSLSGKPVYHATFRRDRHVSKTSLPINPYLPVIVGQDFGLTPAGLWMQMQEDGRIFVLRETPAFDMGTKRYIRSRFRPMQMTTFPTNPIVVIGDPSGVRRADSDEGTSFKEFKDAGYIAKPASTNDPEVRIKALDELFSMYPDGEPAILIDPACKSFIGAMASSYRYPRKKQAFGEEYGEKPDKSHPCSHLVEGGQYGAMFLTGRKYDPADYTVYDDQFNPLATHNPYRPAQKEGY